MGTTGKHKISGRTRGPLTPGAGVFYLSLAVKTARLK